MSTINAAGTVLTVDELAEALGDAGVPFPAGPGVSKHAPIEVAISPDVVAESWEATVTGVAAGMGGVVLTLLTERNEGVVDAITELLSGLDGCRNIREVRNVLSSARTHGELRRYFP